MYSEKVSNRRLSSLESLWKFSVTSYTPEQVEGWNEQLASAWKGGEQVRPLLPEEQRFIKNELILCKASWRYWAERYAKIVSKRGGITTIFPLLDSQEFVLQRLAKLEEESFFGSREDGILLLVLKAARQVGVSTLSEALLAHRTTTETHIFGLIAASVPDDSSYLYQMYRRILDNLPPWMKPAVLAESNTYPEELQFATGSQLWTAAGKSMKGAAGQKGNLGRGRTVHCSHLTELSTWETPEQIPGSLVPAMPLDPATLAIFESTAKGRGNWWHSFWKQSREGLTRFQCVYIPWYVEKTYSLKAPEHWSPSSTTLAHAKRIEETSERWAGRRVEPKREQLYWYEQTRRSYEERDELSTFLEEYGSVDDEECFQNVGRGVFNLAVRNRIKEQARSLKALLEIVPQSDIPTPYGDLPFPIPPGMGFKYIAQSQWKKWKDPKLFFNHLMVWEEPKLQHRYVVAVDVANGVGLDRSVITVVRVGTEQRQDEEVAQWLSDSTDALALAAYADTIGRFYSTADKVAALMAVETNNMGIGTHSQLKRHYGYWNHYRWQHEDSATVKGQFTTKDGWYTGRKTRPLLIGRLVKALVAVDPLTGYPDCRVNSPFTQEELADFQTDGDLWEAQAALGAHDDCLMALAIAIYVAQTLQLEGGEPLDERRRRLAEEQLRVHTLAEMGRQAKDWQNSSATAEQMREGIVWPEDSPLGWEEAETPKWGAY